jgi:exopolyphosphatase/guanosine-5'-triphosphate,3'-diphosphate pyrophosphatase
MRRIAEAHSATIRAVATSAVREASNSHIFLQRVLAETGISIEIISGTEEAGLIYQGVKQSISFGSEPILAIDIGGGSTELSHSVRGKITLAQSLKIGAVRLTDAFMPDGVVTDSAVKKIRAHVSSVFAPLAHDLRRKKFSRTVLSSGTSETLAKMILLRRGGSLPRTMNAFIFSVAELTAVTQMILDAETPQARSQLQGIDPKRSDIIVAGAIILSEIARTLEIESFEFSEFALREGVLIDTANKMGVLVNDSDDAAMESVMRLAVRCSVDLEHASHVAFVAGKILTSVSRHFDVNVALARLLEAAAILANTGNTVSYSKHHIHSYYIIRNADLVGFTDEEIELIALAARYHRKGVPKLSHSEFARLSDNHRHDVELMAGILRIATGLDRSHDQCVSDIASSLKNETFEIKVRHCCPSDESIALNIYTAQERIDLLRSFLGGDILITNAGV